MAICDWQCIEGISSIDFISDHASDHKKIFYCIFYFIKSLVCRLHQSFTIHAMPEGADEIELECGTGS